MSKEDRHPLAEVVGRLIAERGTTMKAASLAAGLGATYARDLIEGRAKNPKQNQLAALLKALGHEMPNLYEPPKVAEPDAGQKSGAEKDVAARFRAARWACWVDSNYVAGLLGLSEADLLSYEIGEKELPRDVLVRFSGETGCPLHWFLEGRMDGMPPVMAARVGLAAPGLIPDRQK